MLPAGRPSCSKWTLSTFLGRECHKPSLARASSALGEWLWPVQDSAVQAAPDFEYISGTLDIGLRSAVFGQSRVRCNSVLCRLCSIPGPYCNGLPCRSTFRSPGRLQHSTSCIPLAFALELMAAFCDVVPAILPGLALGPGLSQGFPAELKGSVPSFRPCGHRSRVACGVWSPGASFRAPKPYIALHS